MVVDLRQFKRLNVKKINMSAQIFRMLSPVFYKTYYDNISAIFLQISVKKVYKGSTTKYKFRLNIFWEKDHVHK